MNDKVKNFLEKNNIDYKLHKHNAVFTCEEAQKYCHMVEGMHCKNLFLKDKKTNDFFLVIMPASKKADLKKIKQITDSKHITFASPDELKEKLALEPGSVSPFGLLNDESKEIKVFIDEDLWDSQIVSFHPNQNDETLEIKKDYFHKAINKLNNKYEIIIL